MTDPWGYTDDIAEVDGHFLELELEPNKILIEQHRNIIYDLLKNGDFNAYRIDFIEIINEFPELNDNSYVQQQVVRMAILYDLANQEWLENLGQYLDGQLQGNWEESPGYNALETNDTELTQFRQQLYKLLS